MTCHRSRLTASMEGFQTNVSAKMSILTFAPVEDLENFAQFSMMVYTPENERLEANNWWLVDVSCFFKSVFSGSMLVFTFFFRHYTLFVFKRIIKV